MALVAETILTPAAGTTPCVAISSSSAPATSPTRPPPADRAGHAPPVDYGTIAAFTIETVSVDGYFSE